MTKESLSLWMSLIALFVSALGVIVSVWQYKKASLVAEIERHNTNLTKRTLRSNSYKEYIDLVMIIYSQLCAKLRDLNKICNEVLDTQYKILWNSYDRDIADDLVTISRAVISSLREELRFQSAEQLNSRLNSLTLWKVYPGSQFRTWKDVLKIRRKSNFENVFSEQNAIKSDEVQRALKNVFEKITNDKAMELTQSFKEASKPVLTWIKEHEEYLTTAIERLNTSFRRNSLEEYELSENQRLYWAMNRIESSLNYILKSPLRYLVISSSPGGAGELLRLTTHLELVCEATWTLDFIFNERRKPDHLSSADLWQPI